MSTKVSGKIVAAATIILIASSSTLPKTGAADSTSCGDGKNLTGQCAEGPNVDSGAIKGVSGAIKYMTGTSSCDKILDSETEKKYLAGLDQINQDYLSGKISIQQHGQQSIDLARTLSHDAAKTNATDHVDALQRALEGKGLAHNSEFTAALQRAIELQVKTGKKLTPAQAAQLKRVGVVVNQSEVLKTNTQGNAPYYQALTAAGVKNNGSGSLDFTGMSGKYTVDQLKQNGPQLPLLRILSAQHRRRPDRPKSQDSGSSA